MAIRFRCRHCRQLLGIASRKAGTEIECPKCGGTQSVPCEEAAQAAMALEKGSMVDATDTVAPNIEVHDDTESDTAQPGREDRHGEDSPHVVQGKPASRTTSEFSATLQSSTAAGDPVPGGMILFPRRVLYIQGGLFCLVALVFLVAGYFMGLGDAGSVRRSAGDATTGSFGKQFVLLFRAEDGSEIPDQGALVIAFPEAPPADGPFSGKDLRLAANKRGVPQDNESDEVLRRIEKSGGAVGLADDEGKLLLAVPTTGTYRVLVVSAHVVSPVNQVFPQAELAQMTEYFESPEELIGSGKYRWMLTEMDEGFGPTRIDFGQVNQP